MATVTPGYIFQNNEVVTPTRLNSAATPSVAVANDEITTDKILNAAVTTAKIADANVTAAKIADANVTTAKIADANVTTAKIADANVTTAKIEDGAVTQSKLNSSVTLVPTGAVMPFAMNSAPSGWLAADGLEYSKTGIYSALFAAIGSTYGETNGSGGAGASHFRVPDLRGIFVRGIGSQTINGVSYSGTIGNKQADAFQGHKHDVNPSAGTAGGNGFFSALVGSNSNTGLITTVTGPTTDGDGPPRTASETRPANIALLYCIKF
jgi:microcystin-dependent protein